MTSFIIAPDCFVSNHQVTLQMTATPTDKLVKPMNSATPAETIVLQSRSGASSPPPLEDIPSPKRARMEDQPIVIDIVEDLTPEEIQMAWQALPMSFLPLQSPKPTKTVGFMLDPFVIDIVKPLTSEEKAIRWYPKPQALTTQKAITQSPTSSNNKRSVAFDLEPYVMEVKLVFR